MLSGILYQPYAHQFTGGRLKFWTVLQKDDDQKLHRYEILVLPDGTALHRIRPIFEGAVPSHQSQFINYLPPSDLSHLRQEHFPRFEMDRLSQAVLSIISDEHAAVLLAYRLTGGPPQKYR